MIIAYLSVRKVAMGIGKTEESWVERLMELIIMQRIQIKRYLERRLDSVFL